MPRNEKPIEQEDIETRSNARKVYKSEKAKQSAEQKDFIPLVEPKHTIEVATKQKLTREQIEHIEEPGKNTKIKSKTSRASKSSKTSSSKNSIYKIPKNKELDGGSILIITEKPQAAAKISAALSGGRARQQKGGQGVYFYEFTKNGENVIVACAVGHLFSLSQDVRGSNYPVFDVSWKPNFEVRKKDFTRKYYINIKKLVNRAKEIIIATDYDVEGEVIGYNIVKYIAGQEDAKRMKFSSLTVKDLEEAYENTQPSLNWGQALGGETRHYLDWFYGINLSRALMNAIKTTGRFKILSIGRVQGPALNLIVKKEKEIQAFKPTTYWRVFLDLVSQKDKDNRVRVKYVKDITEEKELEQFRKLKDKETDVETKKTEQIMPPPTPFDLTTLQTESYKFFSLTPSRTLQIAQKLYLDGLISYPRTSSQKIPDAINPKHILKRLEDNFSKQVKLATQTKPREGEKSDPAHPCFTEDTKINLDNKEITFNDIAKKVREWKYDKSKGSFYSEINVDNVASYNHKNNKNILSKGYKIFKTPIDTEIIKFNQNLKVTKNHEIYSITSKGIGYSQAEEIEKENYIFKKKIILNKKYKIDISKKEIFDAYSKNHQKKIIKKDKRISKSYNQIKKFLEELTLERASTLAKILGFCMGDGHINFKKPTKKREPYPIVHFIGKKEDMLTLKKDIEYLGFSAYLIKKNSDYYYCSSKNSNFGRILIALGCPYGDKVSKRFNIPKWIMNSEREIKSSFIGGLFCAELTKTRIHTKNPRDIRPYTFVQNKIKELKYPFKQYLKNIKRILKDLDIETNNPKIKLRKIIRKKDGNQTVEGILDIKNNRENLIKFLKNINFGYCHYKQKSYRKALAYLLYREILVQNRERLKEKAKILYSKGYKYEDISKIINISKHTIKGWLYYKKGYMENHVSIEEIPRYNDFMGEIPENCAPIIVKHKKLINFKGFVYDLEIKDTHVFFANNILVHNCVYPTGEFQMLSEDDKKVYELIVKRFIACFCQDAKIENKTITATTKDKDQLKFKARGLEVIEKAWMQVYNTKLKEQELQDMEGIADVEEVIIEKDQTKPPNRYSPASIVRELEKRGLGTKCLTEDMKININGVGIPIKDIFSRGKSYFHKKENEIKQINEKTISLNKNKEVIITNPKLISRRKIRENEGIIRIETKNSILKLTEDHIIYISKYGKIKEIKTKNLKIKDKLICIPINYKESSVIANVKDFDNNFKIRNNEIVHKFSSKNSKGIRTSKLPIRWSTSLAWLLGYYYGDGSYSHPKYNGSHSISFTTTEHKALDLLNKNIENVFGNKPYAYNLGTKYKVNCNAPMSYLLINKFPNIEGKIPINIPKEFIGDFLKGFFDADGNAHLRPLGKTIIKGKKCNSFNTPRVKFTLGKDKKLIEWVKELLEKINIKTKINKGTALCNGKRFPCWTILISGRDKIEKFAYEVGFDSYKQKILYSGLKCSSPKYKIIRNCANIALLLSKKEKNLFKLIEETELSKYEVSIALRRMYKLNIITKRRKGRGKQQKWLFSIDNKKTKYLNHCIKLIYKEVKDGIYEIPINSIVKEDYRSYVYDLSVEKNAPNFTIENNILIHNSTRASILETLYDRNYITDQKSIKATQLGIHLIDSLGKYSPIIIDEKLTKEIEEDMEEMHTTTNKSKLKEKQKQVIEQSKTAIEKISKEFHKNEKEIGKELVTATEQAWKQEARDNELDFQCPLCKKGKLAIKYSPKFRRKFIGCNNYPNCKNTFGLPPNGLIKKTEKFCEHCKFPMMMRVMRGKRPWFFCFNMQCPGKEEYNRKKAESEASEKTEKTEKSE